MPLGWFVRGLHSFGSSALIVVSGLHLLQVLLFGAYRRPRELNWMVGLALFGVVRGVRAFGVPAALGPEGLLGEAGRGDDRRQRAGGRRHGPAADPGRRRLRDHDADAGLRAARDGAAGVADRRCWCSTSICSGATATRRSGRCPTEVAAARAVPAWPDQAFRNAVVGLLACGVVAVAVIARHGAPLESPADPTSSYLARPEWYALPLFQLRMFFDGPLEIVATMVIPGIVTALVFALPVPRRRGDESPA